jgi:hypothetical protein
MMAMNDAKLRKVVNLLSDPLQAHAAANILAIEAKERGILVSDLIAEMLGPPPSPTFSHVPHSDSPFASVGRVVNPDVYGLQARVAHETVRAWLVNGPDGVDVWLPKSQCEHHGSDADGRGIFTVPMWLARKKGFPT